MKRRNDAVDRYYKLEEELAEKAQTTKRAMEKAAIDEQMDLERHQRKTIKKQKKAELERAKDDLFADLEDVNEMDSKLQKQSEKEEKKR